MTMQNFQYEGKKRRDSDEIDLTSSALAPAYDAGDEDDNGEGNDQNMLDSFKHVTIPPTIPVPDGNAVEIRIDNHDAGSNDAQEIDRPTQARYKYLTPHRASQEVLPTALSSACRISSFSKVETAEVTKISSSAGQRSSSLSASMDNTNASLPILPAAAPLPPLTVEDMFEALPHRSALFLPRSVEWFVLIPEQDIRKNGKIQEDIWPPLDIPPEVSSVLWKFEGYIKIPVQEQANPIYSVVSSGHQDKLESLEIFDCWRNTRLETLLLNRRGSLPAVLSLSLLERFRDERMSNPRPGSTGESQFKEAISMLIKIIGNAANGEVRALSLNGKALTAKLGFDTISEELLGLVGFSADGKPDENGKYGLIKPPDMTQKVAQIKLRRAWLEVVLWYKHIQSSMSNEASWKEIAPSIPLQPGFGSATSFMERSFSVDADSQLNTKFNFARPHIIDALRFLGADITASEEVVEECYLANTVALSKVEQLTFYSYLQMIGQHLAEAGGSEDIIQTRLALEKSRGLFSEAELKAAFAKFGIEVDSIDHASTIDEDFLLDVYMSAVNSVAGNKEEVQAKKDALDVISASRDRPIRIEEYIAAPVELSVEKAYEILEVTKDIDDAFISSVYSVAITERPGSAAECIEALRVIAEARKSDILRNLYRHALGETEEWQPADLEIPIGLNNIGNTCYLNSVLQYFFAIGKLREQVILASREDVDEIKQNTAFPVVRVGGRQISKREIERSYRFIRQLGQLFSNMISAPTSAVTPERELAYLALVSSRVEETNEVAEVSAKIISASPEVEATHLKRTTSDMQLEKKQEVIVDGLQLKTKSSDESMMVHDIQTQVIAVDAAVNNTSNAEDISATDLSCTEADGIVTPPLPEMPTLPPLPPRPALGALDAHDVGQRRNSLMQLGAQQDVSECLDNVMFQIEVALTAAEQKIEQATVRGNSQAAELDDGWIEDGDLLRRLFLGRTLQRLELASPNTEELDTNIRGPSIHIKREVFTILPIDVVEEERDIYDGLDGFFDEEILIGSQGEPIRRTVTLTDAPTIMQIQLQRVQYDRVKGVYKSQAHLEVGQTLYMDRYLDFDPLNEADMIRLEKRRKGREARKRVAELRERFRALEPEKTPISQTLKQASSFLSSLASLKGKLQDTKSEDAETSKDASRDKEKPGTLSDLSQFLSAEANRVEEEVKEAKKEIAELKSNVEALWEDEKRMEYILTSVFMHRGEASHGHYFLNQRRLIPQDEEPSSTWYKYNDQTVMQVTWNDVHRDQSGATPYLLCWIRRDKLDHFDTLCRKYEVAPLSSVPVEEQAKEGISIENQQDMTTEEISVAAMTQQSATSLDTPKQNGDTIMTDIDAP